MNSVHLYRFLFPVLFSFFLMGCGTDPGFEGEVSELELDGVWEITHAVRNGSPTATLDGAVFVFQDNKFSSNVPGFAEDVREDYSISQDSIYTGATLPEYFLIRSYFENRMELVTVVHGHSFVFEIKKNPIEVDK